MNELTVDVKRLRTKSGWVNAPLNVGLPILRNAGYELVSAPQLIVLRIKQGEESPVSRRDHLVREGIIYFPGEVPYAKAVRNNPILDNVDEALEAQRRGGEYHLSQSQIDASLSDSVDFPIGEVPDLRPDHCGDELPVWLFGGGEPGPILDYTRRGFYAYMEIHPLDEEAINQQSEPFARHISLGGKATGYIDATEYLWHPESDEPFDYTLRGIREGFFF